MKCVLVNNGKLLMLTKSFGSSRWVFPGGAIKAGKDKEVAARREIKEDLDIDLVDLEYLGYFVQNVHHRKETMHCFLAQISPGEINFDKRKIKEVGWFERAKLSKLTPISKSVIALYDKAEFKK